MPGFLKDYTTEANSIDTVINRKHRAYCTTKVLHLTKNPQPSDEILVFSIYRDFRASKQIEQYYSPSVGGIEPSGPASEFLQMLNTRKVDKEHNSCSYSTSFWLLKLTLC